MLGVLAIAALGFLVAHLWHHNHGVTAASSTSLSLPALTTSARRPAKSSPTTTVARTTTRLRTTTQADTRAATTTAASPAAGQVSLLLTAKSDTWLEIRTLNSTGSLLYSGTLGAGSTKQFHAKSFWARFGAAGNVLARLGGRAVSLPSGTYDAIFDNHGFRRVGA